MIIDVKQQNAHPIFHWVANEAQRSDGLFRAVTRVTPLDSVASSMLQFADVVAHPRAWINKEEENAKKLKDAYRIEIL